MGTRQLGKSGIQISSIGFGCMSLATDASVSVPMLHQAFETGITFFDTADLYHQGRNEELVGEAFAGMRHEVVIATKVGNRFEPGKPGWQWDPSPAYIEQAITASLRRLRTDYIDLYQLHGGTMDDPFDDIVETLDRLKQKGWIRAYGISSIRPNVIRRYLQGSQIDTVMMQYSLLDRRPEEWFPEIKEYGVSVIARGPVARGWLTGHKDVNDDTYLKWSAADLKRAIAMLREVAPERTPGQAALAFALSPEVIACAIPGASTPQQLAENAEASKRPGLTEDALVQLKQAFPAALYQEHRPL
ncbi:aryl-alcohol dehydrogenase-like predicted oxidoreductase [Alicyclobacillus sacchari]|uniref:Aryl-alcohol dehydrogenase-like predicted oxidoreductase n=1 Tax=Alicyclobacillus sacchari TaxID=392010 RepID=A0A4R8LKC6_9BACL|nr:aldo/keto reductase [Alicyclobacillus sacchari]TDY44601.1 aryl-alcohol dehydrogenase-like predicted oxidoreductase [Alicyclobacillus sacchari]